MSEGFESIFVNMNVPKNEREMFFRENRERYVDAFAMYNRTFIEQNPEKGATPEGVQEGIDFAKSSADMLLESLRTFAPEPLSESEKIWFQTTPRDERFLRSRDERLDEDEEVDNAPL